jgi:general secretion pathway protein D
MMPIAGRLFVAALAALALLVVSPARAEKEAAEVSLNFVNADIDSVVHAISRITNRNFLIDPRVKGTLNIVTSKPVTAETAYQILLSALRMQGFAVVSDGGVVKVVPEADARLQPLPVAKSRGELRGDRPITQIFYIKNESAAQLLAALKPQLAPNNSITAYANNNTLIVTDYADNVERIARIIDAVDVPQGDAIVIPLMHIAAQDIAQTVSRLFGENAGGDPSQHVTVVPDGRLNALVIRSENLSRIKSIRELVANLDRPEAAGNIHIVFLKNADATKLAQTLRAAVTGQSAGATTAAGTTAPTASTTMRSSQGQTAASTGGGAGGEMIQADSATNSLIITAPEAIYNNLREIIDKLDRRRAQVFVEALIAEITADHVAELGFQFQNGNTGNGGAAAFGGTNFSSGGTNIVSVSGSPTSIAGGLNLAVAKGTLTLPNGTTVLNLAMLAHFLETQTNTNILSTPNMVMLDNEEAKFVVGQNLPFVTGQYTNTGGGTTVANPFQTIERRDVGLTLRVRPQIAEGGALVLQLYQESSSVVSTSLSNSAGPTTNKRSIETTAVVDDGQIIALGGLVQDSYTAGVEKVPLLGDVPIIGNLFRYDSHQRSKTNLYVFLRPVILRDRGSYQSLTSDRYDYMIGQQRGINAFPSSTLLPKESSPPELPPLDRQFLHQEAVPAPSGDPAPR